MKNKFGESTHLVDEKNEKNVKSKANNIQIESNHVNQTESTYLGTGVKITEVDISENAKLELTELEGNILDGKTLFINAGGLETGGLRNARDGCTFFGYVKNKNGLIVNDFIVNMANNFGLNLTTAFKIYFDKSIKNYFLSPIGSEDESVLFVKLEKPFKINKRHIISLGEIHFSCEVDPTDYSLKIELAFGNEETKTKIFQKELYQVVKIGRNRDNDLVLENYAYSRVHTSFFYDKTDKSWYVQDGISDKTSTNGTWIYLDWPWRIEEIVHFRIGSNFLRIRKI